MTNSRLPSVVSPIPPDLRSFIERVREFQSQPVASVAKDAVGTANLSKGAVLAEKLAAGAVLAEKIAKDAVTTEKLINGGVTTDKLAAGSVTTDKLANGAVTAAKVTLTASDIGAAPAGGSLSTDWLCQNLRTSTGYLYSQASGGSINGSVDLYDAAVSNRMVFRNAAGFQFYGSLSDATLGNVYAGDFSGDTYHMTGDPDTGMYSGGANILGFATGGVERAIFNAAGHFQPFADNTYNLGASGTAGGSRRAWKEIFYYTATSYSDKDGKTDVADSDLGLDFIDALRPVKFRWKVAEYLPSKEKDADGKPILTPRPGVRFHYGLLADELKEALGERDFGGYVEDAESGQKGLRWDEIDGVIIKAVQELYSQVKEERQSRLALEQRLAALELALGPIGSPKGKA
jgi:hypothetical protein